MVGITEIQEAAHRLEGVAHRTPVLTSNSLSRMLGRRLLIKAEHLQRTGSFKIRGAYNTISTLSPAEREAGVVAASAGNHAQGVARAAGMLGVRSTIVMPSYASIPKVQATRGYGAEIVLHGDVVEEALEEAGRIAAQTGAFLIHPFDEERVIAGQGTVGTELCEQTSGLGTVVVPVGGGGLISGISLAVKALSPGTRVIGVRPASIPATIADGAAIKSPSGATPPIIERCVDEMVEVDEEHISEALVLTLERTKQLVEGAGALGLAALLAKEVKGEEDTAIIASGGNIDSELLSRVIRSGLQGAGRYLLTRLRIRDRPGALQRVLALLAQMSVNVVSITHHRLGLTLPVNDVEVELTLETRDHDHALEVINELKKAGYSPSATTPST